MVEKTGVQSVWDNSQFKKGADEYLKVLGVGENATAAFVNKIGGIAGAATSSLPGMGAIAGVLLGGAGLYFGFKAVAGAVGEFIGGLKDATIEGTQFAGRIQELTLVAQLLSQRLGNTEEATTASIKTIKELGIRTDVAAQLVAQFSRYQLDLASATKLARVAQDAAVLSASDSSDALDNLLYGVLRYNTRVLRTAGLNVDVQQGFDKMADSLGKETDALSETEKITATLNAVLEEGARIQGVYEIAMTAPAKQLRSLSQREIPELKAALGEPFLNAWALAIRGIRDFVKGLTIAMSEGGRLYPLLVKIGAVASIMADGFANFVRNGLDVLINGIDSTSSGVVKFIADAFKWGQDLVFNFAEGIIKASSTVLVGAMNFMSNILSGWLSSHSPPKVAPGIIQWGIDAMNQYLHGFTQADFDILKAVQGPISQMLGALAASGQLTAVEAAQAQVDIMRRLVSGISGGGISADIFGNLGAIFGDMGTEILKLAYDQQALADATNSVKDAEDALAEAREREKNASAGVNLAVRAYNDALREGASPDVLNAKRDAIDAAYDERTAAQKAAAEQEDSLVLAKEQMEVLKEQAALQQNLVSALMDFVRAQQQAAAAVAAAASETDEGELPLPPVPDIDFKSPLQLAIEDAKAMLLERWGAMWDELKSMWDERVGPLLDPILSAWDNLKTNIAAVWESIKTNTLAPTWTWIQEEYGKLAVWLDTQTGEIVASLSKWWDEHKGSVQTILDWLKTDGYPGFKVQADQAMIDWGDIWTRGWENAGDILREQWEILQAKFQLYLDQFGFILDGVANIIKGNWAQLWADILTELTTWWENIVNSPIGQLISDALGAIGSSPFFQPNRGRGGDDLGSINPFTAPSSTSVFETKTSNVSNNFGGVNINNGMDLASLDAHILQVVRQGIGR